VGKCDAKEAWYFAATQKKKAEAIILAAEAGKGRGNMARSSVLLVLVIIVALWCGSIQAWAPKRLVDGVIVLGGEAVRKQRGTWDIFIVQTSAQNYGENWDVLLASVEQMISTLREKQDTEKIWAHYTQRIEAMKNRRLRRGLFDFVGDISSKLFGTARQSDVDAVIKAVSELAQQNMHVAYSINQMQSYINKTTAELQTDRDRLNLVTTHINTLQMDLTTIRRALNDQAKRIALLEIGAQLEQVVSLLEEYARDALKRASEWKAQRMDMDQGVLSENLVDREHLQEALDNAGGSALPLDWYYGNVPVTTVAISPNELVFIASIPLVSSDKYLAYDIKTLPVPGSVNGTTLQLSCEGIVVVETTNGDLFNPSHCIGHNPIVCHSGPIFDVTKKTCVRGILNGETKLHKECDVILGKTLKTSIVREVALNVYVLATNGEDFNLRCKSKIDEPGTFEAGAYRIDLPKDCNLRGSGWILSEIEHYQQKLELHVQVIEVPNVNLTKLIPAEKLLPMMSYTDISLLGKVSPVELEKLHLNRVIIKNVPHHYILYGCIAGIIIISVGIVVGVLGWRWYKRRPSPAITYVPTMEKVDIVMPTEKPKGLWPTFGDTLQKITEKA